MKKLFKRLILVFVLCWIPAIISYFADKETFYFNTATLDDGRYVTPYNLMLLTSKDIKGIKINEFQFSENKGILLKFSIECNRSNVKTILDIIDEKGKYLNLRELSIDEINKSFSEEILNRNQTDVIFTVIDKVYLIPEDTKFIYNPFQSVGNF